MIRVFLLIAALLASLLIGIWLAREDALEERARLEGLIFQEQKTEHKRLLIKHGLQYQISVIEIDKDGLLWFWRNGNKCKFN
ncbi:MAG: hypothetical protein Q8M94_08320 [Ignavibacteria bacterium]|nr:hypothetical protein [Ignavibacteria bacterium]